MLDWKKINEAAEKLGVQPETRKKWRTRKSVPHYMRMAIYELTRGRVKVFEEREEDSEELV